MVMAASKMKAPDAVAESCDIPEKPRPMERTMPETAPVSIIPAQNKTHPFGWSGVSQVTWEQTDNGWSPKMNGGASATTTVTVAKTTIDIDPRNYTPSMEEWLQDGLNLPNGEVHSGRFHVRSAEDQSVVVGTARLWRGKSSHTNDVYLYLPGSGGGPEVYLDMTQKEHNKSTFSKLHHDHTWIVIDTSKVGGKKRWKEQIPSWYHDFARELGRQVADKGGRLCFVGFSRGAFWGVSLMMETAGLFKRAVLIAPYVTGNLNTSPDGMNQLATNIKDSLVLVCASKKDASCVWATESAFLLGMQNIAEGSWHVHIEESGTHEEMRLFCIVGGSEKRLRASTLTIEVLYQWDESRLDSELPVNT
jgi:hypothetical protein